jgi:hypothetical protein
MQRIIADWKSFIHKVSNLHAPWLSVETYLGPAAVSEIYSQVLSGNVDPKVGLMLSLSTQKSSHIVNVTGATAVGLASKVGGDKANVNASIT